MIQYSITYYHASNITHLHRIPIESLPFVIKDITGMNGVIIKIWLDVDTSVQTECPPLDIINDSI